VGVVGVVKVQRDAVDLNDWMRHHIVADNRSPWYR